MIIDLSKLLNKVLIIASEETIYVLEGVIKIEMKTNELTCFARTEIRNLFQTINIVLNYIIIFQPLG